MKNWEKCLRVLANEKRLQLWQWLGDPKSHLNDLIVDQHQVFTDDDNQGVCVGLLQKKSGLSQSTVSQYLAQMEAVGLVSASKRGTWVHYSRNPLAMQQLTNFLTGL